MRTEQTLNLTGAGASLPGVVSADTQNIPSFSAQPLAVVGHPSVESLPRGNQVGGVDPEQWKVDEHWTAVTAYLADLYLPNEG